MTLSRIAALFWSAAAALMIVSSWPLRWWHPYCDTPADELGYYAVGGPLPYREPTGIFPLQNTILLLPFAFDVLVFAAILFALAWILMRKRAAPRRWIGLATAWSGGLVFALLLGAIIFAIHVFDVPAWSFLSPDSYFSYRPLSLVAGHGAKPCAG
jgi:hypothetical protein